MKAEKRFLCTIDEEDGELVTLRVAPVDLRALLELADEIYDTSCNNHGELSVSLVDIWGWSQAICEALGVEDFRPWMDECERRNRERGRITK